MPEIPWGPEHPHYHETVEDFFGEHPWPDFEHWKRLSYWTIEEAVALSFGYDPELVNSSSLEWSDHPFARTYRERKVRIERAGEAGQIKAKPTPVEFVRWATETGLEVGPELLQLIAPPPDALAKAPAATKAADGTPVKEAVQEADVTKGGQEVEVTSNTPRDLPPRVRKTLLKIILGMAMQKYHFDPKSTRSHAAGNISSSLRLAGLPVDEDTIRKYLNEAVAEVWADKE